VAAAAVNIVRNLDRMGVCLHSCRANCFGRDGGNTWAVKTSDRSLAARPGDPTRAPLIVPSGG
jgi:hypothetical protein